MIVVIKPCGAGSPAGSAQAGLFRHIRKRPIAIVVIQNAAAVLRDVEIGPAVIIIVSYGGAHPVAAAGNTRFFRDVGKSAVAIVVAQRVTQRRIWSEEITLPAVDQVHVHPAVVVVIEKGATRSCRLGQIVFRRAPVHVAPGDPADCGWRLFKQRRRGSWYKPSRSPPVEP